MIVVGEILSRRPMPTLGFCHNLTGVNFDLSITTLKQMPHMIIVLKNKSWAS